MLPFINKNLDPRLNRKTGIYSKIDFSNKLSSPCLNKPVIVPVSNIQVPVSSITITKNSRPLFTVKDIPTPSMSPSSPPRYEDVMETEDIIKIVSDLDIEEITPTKCQPDIFRTLMDELIDEIEKRENSTQIGLELDV